MRGRSLPWGLLCLAVLGACTAEPSPVPDASTSVESTANTQDTDTEDEADDVTAADDEADASDESVDGGGTLTASTLSGQTEVTMTAPEGWRLHGVEEAISDFDIVTAIRGGDDAPVQTVVVSDQQLGVSALEVFETAVAVHRESSEHYSDVTVLDPMTIDGIEFHGFEAVVHASTGISRMQNWYGDAGDTVLGIYLHHGGDDSIPDELLQIRDSLTFE